MEDNAEGVRKAMPRRGSAAVVAIGVLACAGLMAAVAVARSTHEVGTSGNSWIPASVAAQTGDTVEWTFSASHNLNLLDPEGVPILTDEPPDGTTSHVFNAAGNYVYYCSIHGSPTGGMQGEVEVFDSGPDATPPTTTASLNPSTPNGQNSWYTSGVQVTLTAVDNPFGSGVASISYQLDGGGFQTYSAPFTVSTQGTHTVQFRSTDNEENQETTKAVSFKIDSVAPTATASVDPASPDGLAGWYVTMPEVTLAGEDPGGSAVARLEYRVGTAGGFTTYNLPFLVPGEGARTLQYRAVDTAGNTPVVPSAINFQIDTAAPSTTAALNGSPPTGGTYGSPVHVALGATDASSGVDSTEFNLDGAGFADYSGAFDISGAGSHSLQYRSADVAGNVEDAGETNFTIVAGAPALELTAPARKRAKVGKTAQLEVEISNTGEADANGVEVCARANGKLVAIKGEECRELGNLAPEDSATATFGVKPKAKAGGKSVKVTFTATADGAEPAEAKTTLSVKKK